MVRNRRRVWIIDIGSLLSFSRLQLAFELVQEAPIRTVGDDFGAPFYFFQRGGAAISRLAFRPARPTGLNCWPFGLVRNIPLYLAV